jgi:hypothetical protein
VGLLAVTFPLIAGCASDASTSRTAADGGPSLKYQDGEGPPCMCTGGLSEADIQEAGESDSRE